MEANKLAILIPVFNDDRGLNKTIDALENSLLPKCTTIVVVDDGSDPPVRVSDSRSLNIKLIRKRENGGIVSAMNTGLRWIYERDFDFIGRIDAGDIASDSRFIQQLKILELDERIVIVGGAADFETIEGNRLFRFNLPCDDDGIRAQAAVRSPFVHPAVLMRASACKNVGYYSECFPAAEDYDFFMRILKKGEGRNLNEVVVRKEVAGGISVKRRRTQLISTAKVQFHSFAILSWRAYFGVAVTLVRLSLPYGIALKLKTIFWKDGRKNSNRIDLQSQAR